MEDKIRAILEESITVKRKILENKELINKISEAAKLMIESIQKGGKIIICGNGGSAADSQHFAAELIGKFLKIRKALPAISITTNTSILTAIANDTSFSDVFARQLNAIGEKGDILIAISTSGNSANVVNAAKVAQSKGLQVISLTGEGGGKLGNISNILINIPSKSTPRIQEAHITILHILAELIEEHLTK